MGKKALCIQLGRLGDVVQGMIVAAALQRCRGYDVDLLVRAELCSLSKSPLLRRRFGIVERGESGVRVAALDYGALAAPAAGDPRAPAERLGSMLAEALPGPFELVANLTSSVASAWLAGWAASHGRAGGDMPGAVAGLSADDTATSAGGEWFRLLLAVPSARRENPYNLVDFYLRGLGIAASHVPAALSPEARRQASAAARAALALPPELPVLGLVPGASHPRRQWPPNAFARTVQMLCDRLPRPPAVVLFGTSAESEVARAIAANLPAGVPVRDLAGQTALADLPEMLAAAAVVVTNDTGAMHVAAAVGVPTVTTSLATSCPQEIAPYGDGHVMLQAALACAPCDHGYRCPHEACRWTIAPEDVARCAGRFLDAPTSSPLASGRKDGGSATRAIETARGPLGLRLTTTGARDAREDSVRTLAEAVFDRLLGVPGGAAPPPPPPPLDHWPVGLVSRYFDLKSKEAAASPPPGARILSGEIEAEERLLAQWRSGAVTGVLESPPPPPVASPPRPPAVSASPAPSALLKILVVGAVEGGSQPMAASLARGLECLGHEVRLFDGSVFAPAQRACTNLPASPAAQARVRHNLLFWLSEAAYASAVDFGAHAVVALAQAPLLDSALARMRQDGMLTALWFVEDGRQMRYWQDVAARYDVLFTIQAGELGEQIARAGGTAVYLPAACDPEVHRPRELSGTERRRFAGDLTFVGAPYWGRKRLLRELADLPLRVFGDGWEVEPWLRPLIGNGGQRLTAGEVTAVYCSSRINLNVHSDAPGSFLPPGGDYVNPRTFEVAGSGGFQLVDRRSLLAGLFDLGTELVTFSDVGELRELCRHFLAHPEQARAIAAAARSRVLREHTYAHRAATIVDNLLALPRAERLLASRAGALATASRAAGRSGLALLLDAYPADKVMDLDLLTAGFRPSPDLPRPRLALLMLAQVLNDAQVHGRVAGV